MPQTQVATPLGKLALGHLMAMRERQLADGVGLAELSNAFDNCRVG